jgi:UDP-N-acetylglucosamine acyltransferase
MNNIHPTAIIDSRVELGENNTIGPYTVISGPTIIGNNNLIGSHVVIGSPGQDTRKPRYDSSNSVIEIGDNNIIREFTAIQKPCYSDITKIGNNVYLMQSVLIPHDANLRDNVVVTPMCVLGGLTQVLDGANIGLGAKIHQHIVIGHYSLVAMGSIVTKNIKPFAIYLNGQPLRTNLYAIEKFGFSLFEDEIVKYVIEDVKPKNDLVYGIIEDFNKLHISSKRNIYK